jgi:hypothetical protein
VDFDAGTLERKPHQKNQEKGFWWPERRRVKITNISNIDKELTRAWQLLSSGAHDLKKMIWCLQR